MVTNIITCGKFGSVKVEEDAQPYAVSLIVDMHAGNGNDKEIGINCSLFIATKA